MSYSATTQDTVAFWGSEVARHRLVYPDENIVRFLAKRCQPIAHNEGKHGLEVGCGSGRNLLLLNDFGFTVRGIDISDQAVSASRELLDQQGIAGAVEKRDLASLSGSDQKHHCILWDSPALARRSQALQNIDTLTKALASEGQMWVKFRSPESWFFGAGEELEHQTFLLDAQAGEYAGLTYTFFNQDEASKALSEAGLETTNIERIELWKNNAQERHVWLLFWTRKSG